MISVVVVSKENEVGIAKTLASIKCKEKSSYEIIIKRYALRKTFVRRENILEISGPDKGIYHAMNIASSHASFNWLCFMNAGDQFSLPLDVLIEKVSENLEKKVLYGDHIVDGKNVKKALTVNYLRFGSAFCHQSTIIRSDVLKNGYNDCYKYAADYDLFASLFPSRKSIEKIDIVISNIESGGVSDTNRIEVYREWYDIQNHYFRCYKLNSIVYRFRVLKEYARSYLFK